MAFFDKLNDIARTVSDMTSEALETTKMSSKINSEKSSVSELQKKIGEYYYNKYAEGQSVDEEILPLFTEIDEHLKIISDAQAEIERIKQQAEDTKSETSVPSDNPDANTCNNCGASNAIGTKFCSECGNKLEIQPSSKSFCPQCGSEISEGVKFCGGCGFKL